jgi:phosphoribosylaminoimidazole-succinocarboxamide synthase
MNYEKKSQIREGKAKILFETTDPNCIIQHFKDDATAFNALKKGTIKNKGALNNSISTLIFKYLNEQGIPTHFVDTLNETDMVIKKLKMIPVECVVRNKATGSICKRLGIEKGLTFEPPLVEYFYKSDELGDPLISESHILYFKWSSDKELMLMCSLSLKVNQVLVPLFKEISLDLIDFKLEFGKDSSGKLFLADEFTPDGCRLWDLNSKESMDKDRFRQDLGKVEEAYIEVHQRLQDYFKKEKA